jgi:hypothetical protein
MRLLKLLLVEFAGQHYIAVAELLKRECSWSRGKRTWKPQVRSHNPGSDERSRLDKLSTRSFDVTGHIVLPPLEGPRGTFSDLLGETAPPCIHKYEGRTQE